MECNLIFPISSPPLSPSFAAVLTRSLSYRCSFSFMPLSPSLSPVAYSFPCVLIFSLHCFFLTPFPPETDSHSSKAHKQEKTGAGDSWSCPVFIQNAVEKIIFFASCLISVPLFISFHMILSLYCNKHLLIFCLLLFQDLW